VTQEQILGHTDVDLFGAGSPSGSCRWTGASRSQQPSLKEVVPLDGDAPICR
jgi:hypothetical protein